LSRKYFRASKYKAKEAIIQILTSTGHQQIQAKITMLASYRILDQGIKLLN
jgi:hypothetical protein